jgi:hypothetical protein
VTDHTFKPGDRVRHNNGVEGWVVSRPRVWVHNERGRTFVLADGCAEVGTQETRCLTLISDRYEPIGGACCFSETHYRLVPPSHPAQVRV